MKIINNLKGIRTQRKIAQKQLAEWWTLWRYLRDWGQGVTLITPCPEGFKTSSVGVTDELVCGTRADLRSC